MGKYLKKSKPKSSAEVSQPPPSSCGVRTRARTLALQRLRQPPPPPPEQSESDSELSYLQLRSRRLHKSTVSSKGKGKERERKASAGDIEENGECRGVYPSDSFAASFGENDPEAFDPRDRRTRESTPCSFIGGSIAVPMPGSTNRRRSSNSSQRIIPNDLLGDIPTTHEMDDFFAAAEEQQRKSFIEKYNFDILNDTPLEGRYEWLEVMP